MNVESYYHRISIKVHQGIAAFRVSITFGILDSYGTFVRVE